jgi:hypothetical protein
MMESETPMRPTSPPDEKIIELVKCVTSTQDSAVLSDPKNVALRLFVSAFSHAEEFPFGVIGASLAIHNALKAEIVNTLNPELEEVRREFVKPIAKIGRLASLAVATTVVIGVAGISRQLR